MSWPAAKHFSLHFRRLETAGMDDVALGDGWRNLVEAVRDAIDTLGFDHEMDTAAARSVTVSAGSGWVCLRVTHGTVDELAQLRVMRGVAAAVAEHVRDRRVRTCSMPFGPSRCAR